MRKLFVGRLSRRTRVADVEDVFDRYGRLTRCDVKYGQDTAYAFVDYENDQDAEDAIASENGRKLLGATMVVEWSKGHSKSLPIGRPSDECYRCGMRGHFGRDCRMSGFRSYGRGRSPVGRRSSRYSRSRSRSRSSRRSRSRSPRRSRTPRRSRSKSPRKSSVSPRRSGSKSPRRSPSPKRSPQGSPRKSRSRSPRSRSR